MYVGALLHGIWSVVGNTLLGAGLILSLIGLARSAGFSVGLLPSAVVRVNSVRVIVDALIVGGFTYIATAHLVDRRGAFHLGEITDLDFTVARRWLWIVPAGLAVLWFFAVRRTFRQARRQPDHAAGSTPVLVVRSVVNPDRYFRAGRSVDTWISSERRELRTVLVEVLLGHLKFLLVRDDPMTGFAKSGPDRHASTTNAEADARIRWLTPVGSLALLWAWVLWRLPPFLALPVTDLPIRALGAALPGSVATALSHGVWWDLSHFSTVDVLVLFCVVFLYVMPRGTIIGNGFLILGASALLLGAVTLVGTAVTVSLWSVLFSIPVIAVMYRLGTAKDYRVAGSHTRPGGRSDNTRALVRAVLATVIMTLLAAWFAADSYANAYAGTSGQTSSYYPAALHDLAGYAGWTLLYLIGVHIIALMFNHWTVGPLSGTAAQQTALWLPIVGFYALGYVLPHAIRAGGGRIVYVGDAAFNEAPGPAPQAWMTGPALCIFGYSLVIMFCLLSRTGRLAPEPPEEVTV
jgi:hypothetical protein